MKGFLSSFVILWCAAASAQTWTSQGGTNYTLTMGNEQVLVEAAYGARISSFKLNGNEFFMTGIDTRGSTFWVSPQSVYQSFPAVLDTGAYSPSLQNGNTNLVLTSAVDSAGTGFQVIKNIRGNSADNSILITYTLVNKSGVAKSASPWELTRVPVNGITFFPKGSAWFRSYNPGSPPPFPPALENTVVWVQDHAVEGQKLFRDGGEGWIAHIHDGMIFIKQYPDVLTNNFAPGESDVELWSSSGFEELEIQGAYASLTNNASYSWTVKYFLRSIPANVSPTVGSTNVLQLARDINATGCNSQLVIFPAIPNKSTTDPDFPINATASSGLPVTFSLISGPATITGNSVHLTGTAGTVIIAAQQLGDSQHCSAVTQNSFTVTAPPQFAQFSVLNNGSFAMNGTGPTGQGYRIFAATNITQPFSNWLPVQTGTFTGGIFGFTNTQITNLSQRFYRVVTP